MKILSKLHSKSNWWNLTILEHHNHDATLREYFQYYFSNCMFGNQSRFEANLLRYFISHLEFLLTVFTQKYHDYLTFI